MMSMNDKKNVVEEAVAYVGQTIDIIKEAIPQSKILNNPLINTLNHPIVSITESINHGKSNYESCVNNNPNEKVGCATASIIGTTTEIISDVLATGIKTGGIALVATGSILSVTGVGSLAGVTEMSIGTSIVTGGTYLSLYSRELGDDIFGMIKKQMIDDKKIDFSKDIIIKDTFNNKIYKFKPTESDIMIYNKATNVHDKSITLRDKIHNNNINMFLDGIDNSINRTEMKILKCEQVLSEIVEIPDKEISVEQLFNKYNDKYFKTAPVEKPECVVQLGGSGGYCSGGGGGGSGFCFVIMIPIFSLSFSCIIC